MWFHDLFSYILKNLSPFSLMRDKRQLHGNLYKSQYYPNKIYAILSPLQKRRSEQNALAYPRNTTVWRLSLVRNRVVKSRWPLRKHTQNRVLHRQTDKAGLQRKQVLPVAVQRTRHRAVRVLQAKGPADSAPLAVQCRGFRQTGGRGVRAEGGARRRTAD